MPVVDSDVQDLLHALPVGSSEWPCTPPSGAETGAEADLGRAARRADHEFLSSPLAGNALREHGILATDHRRLQEVRAAAH